MDIETIQIEFGAVENDHVDRAGKPCGWLPVIWHNGRLRGNTYAPHGYDRDEAIEMARVRADEEREQYIGDWEVVVRQREGV